MALHASRAQPLRRPAAARSSPRAFGSVIREALLLDQEEADKGLELGFLARALVQATLPHRDPRRNEFVRRNGLYTLSVLAPADIGVPFGRYPRLVLAFLCTEAVRSRSRHVELDHRFSGFCSRLGVNPTSGPRGSLPLLREQMQRLFASTFQCICHRESHGQHAGDGFLIVERRALWWEPQGNGRDFGAYVELSDRFFREATEAPVPLDLRILQALRSPLEIDLYVWLTWRLFRLSKPVTVPWRSLQLQFGCGYRNHRHFKHRFLRYLHRVIRYYPAARLGETPEGLVLRPSAPHVPPRLLPCRQRVTTGAELAAPL